MKKDPTTKDVLDAFTFTSAESLKSEQTKLTRTANQVFGVTTGRLKGLFSEDELETLRKAGALLNNIKRRVEAAKEAKERQEKEAERLRKLNSEKSGRLLDTHIPDSEADSKTKLQLVLFVLLLHKNKHLLRYSFQTISDYSSVSQSRPNVAALVDEMRTRFNGALLAEKNGVSNRTNPDLPYDTLAAFFRDLYSLARESCRQDFYAEKDVFTELFQGFLVKVEQGVAELSPEETALLEHIEVSLFAMEAIKAAKVTGNGN